MRLDRIHRAGLLELCSQQRLWRQAAAAHALHGHGGAVLVACEAEVLRGPSQQAAQARQSLQGVHAFLVEPKVEMPLERAAFQAAASGESCFRWLQVQLAALRIDLVDVEVEAAAL